MAERYNPFMTSEAKRRMAQIPPEFLAQLTPEQRARFVAANSPQRFDGTVAPRVQQMTNVNPTLRDRAFGAAVDAFGMSPEGRRRANTAMNALDTIDPGLMILSDANRDFNQGNTGQAAIGTGIGLAGIIPGVGPGMKAIQKGIPDGAIKNLPDLPRANIFIDDIAETNLADRIGTTGKYRGAPRNVTSEQKLGAMRRSLRNSLTRGSTGRDWYENSSRTASELTGGRDGYKDLYSGTVALTSQGASVPGNQTFAARGYNQAITGNEIDTGRFPQSARRGIEGMQSGEPTTFGPKRTPFFEALNVEPGEAASRPTNDLWMARAFDYRTESGDVWSEGLGEAQHRFMDKEINNLVDWANENKVSGMTNWTPEKVQASIWVDTKANFEGKPVETAAYDFSDNLDALTANINVESEAARGLNHLSGSRDNPELAEMLQSGQRQILSNNGRDGVALSAGALTRPTGSGFGYYKGNSAPTDVLQVIAGPASGSNQIDAASRDLVEGIAATQGLLRGQESVGYNFIRDAAGADRNAAKVNIGRAPTQQEMLEVGEKLSDTFGGSIFPVNSAEGVNFLSVGSPNAYAVRAGKIRSKKYPNGIRRDQFDATDDGLKKYQAAVRAEITKSVNDISKSVFDTKAAFGRNSGDLVGNFEAFKPSTYLPAIENSGVAEQLSRAAQQAAPALEQLDELLVKNYPEIGARSEIMMRTRQALAEGGIPLVRKLVDQGLLPAVVLGAIGSYASAQRQSPQSVGAFGGV